MTEPDTMTPSCLDMTKELTIAVIHVSSLQLDGMQDFMRDLHMLLLQLQAQENAIAAGVLSDTQAPAGVPMDWKKSINRHAITCMECGRTFRQLPNRHFRLHGLDSRSYRDKYGIPRSQSLAARETTARRKQIVQQSRPWEKTATYRQRQRQHGTASKKANPTATSPRSTRRKKAARRPPSRDR